MSSVTMSQCDVCKKRVDDRYVSVGWIHTSGLVSISKGRKNGIYGDARTGYATAGERDFCSLKCYTEWLKKL